MRIVFMGTPDFASGCLEALIEKKYNIVGAFCQPDRPKGRGHKLTPPPVKELALKHGIPVYQPEKMRDGTALGVLRELSPDIIVVVAYGKILPKEILELPKYGCINVHGSLLPALRGAAPIQWAVINGLKTTGVTVMKMDEGMDTGDILTMAETEIGEDETSGELFDKLCVLGAQLLVDTIDDYVDGKITPIKQDEALATHAPMLDKELSRINWSLDAPSIHNLIRGLCPWPVAVTFCGDTRIKVFSSRVVKGSKTAAPGEILENKDTLVVQCGGDTAIELNSLQRDGSKRMDTSEFLRGFHIEKGTVLS